MINIRNLNRAYIWYPPLLATVLYGIYVTASNFSSPENFSWIFLFKSVIQFYCYLVFVHLSDRWLTRQVNLSKGLRLVSTFVCGWVLSLITGLLLYLLVKQSFIIYFDQADEIGLHHLVVTILSITVGYVLIFSVYLVNRSYNERLEAERKRMRFEQEKIKLQYELLYNKLEPHFLFNNLNTLHSLIVEKSPVAEEYVMSLSKVMRYSFQAQEQESVSLKEELEVFEHYMTILKERTGDCLNYRVHKSGNELKKIIPMTLPNLLENVIKHNEISQDKPMEISLELNSDHLLMSNTFNLKGKSTDTGTGGLRTLEEMYKLRTAESIEISVENGLFKVKIPYLNS